MQIYATLNKSGNDMKYGYSRVYSNSQSYDLPVENLIKYGVAEDCIRAEKVSGKSLEGRTELNTLMSFLRSGDTLVCTKLDRLGRSVRDIENIVNELEKKNISLVFTDQNIDTSNPTGKCFLQMMSVFAEFERNMIATRRNEGIEKAKANGVQMGRKQSIDRNQVMQLKQQGFTPTQIAKKMNINRTTVYRVFNAK